MGLMNVGASIGFLFILHPTSAEAGKIEDRRKIEARIRQEKPTHLPGEIALKGAQTFAEIPELTESQRLMLLKINQETADRAQLIKTEMIQTKLTLFKTLAKPNYKKSEIEIIKHKILELDRKRLDIMLNSLFQIEQILKYNKFDKQNLYKNLFLESP